MPVLNAVLNQRSSAQMTLQACPGEVAGVPKGSCRCAQAERRRMGKEGFAPSLAPSLAHRHPELSQGLRPALCGWAETHAADASAGQAESVL